MWDVFCAVALIGAIAAVNIWANWHKIVSGYYDTPEPEEPEGVSGFTDTEAFDPDEEPDIWHDINYRSIPGNIYHSPFDDD